MTRSPPLQRILFVENDPDIQAIGMLSLETLGGFDVRLCDSGFAALRYATAFSPDLLLLNVVMPQMDGPTTLQALRVLPAIAYTPVIFITANAEPYEVKRYYALGAIGVVAKPFDPFKLSNSIKTIWAQAHI